MTCILALFFLFFGFSGYVASVNAADSDCAPKMFAGVAIRENPLLENDRYKHLKKYPALPKDIATRYFDLVTGKAVEKIFIGTPRETRIHTVESLGINSGDIKEWIPMRGDFVEHIGLFEVTSFSHKAKNGESYILLREVSEPGVPVAPAIAVPLDKVGEEGLTTIAKARQQAFGNSMPQGHGAKPNATQVNPKSMQEALGLNRRNMRRGGPRAPKREGY